MMNPSIFRPGRFFISPVWAANTQITSLNLLAASKLQLTQARTRQRASENFDLTNYFFSVAVFSFWKNSCASLAVLSATAPVVWVLFPAGLTVGEGSVFP